MVRERYEQKFPVLERTRKNTISQIHKSKGISTAICWRQTRRSGYCMDTLFQLQKLLRFCWFSEAVLTFEVVFFYSPCIASCLSPSWFLFFSEFSSTWFGPMRFCSCSGVKSCPILCHPVDSSTPGFPVLHHLLEFAHTHVLQVGDAIQPPHPLSPPSLPAFSLSQHQGLFQWVGSWHQVAKSKLLDWLAGQVGHFFKLYTFDSVILT